MYLIVGNYTYIYIHTHLRLLARRTKVPKAAPRPKAAPKAKLAKLAKPQVTQAAVEKEKGGTRPEKCGIRNVG